MNVYSDIILILQELDHLLSPEDLIRANEYLSHNEPGVALELICTQIIEYELKVPKKLFKKIENVSC